MTDFLPQDLRSGKIIRSFEVPGSVKDMIESCGIPHTEVDLIVANGDSVDFSYRVTNGDCVSVFPMFEAFDITPILKVRPEPLRTVRFVADNHLRRLARFLRLLGLDTLHDQHWNDPELVAISTSQQRVLLTQDVNLLKHGLVTHGCYVRATDPREQVTEVVRRFHLARHLTPFTRCMDCNGELIPIAKEEIAHRLASGTSRHVDDFRVCSSCDKVYWRGAHHSELRRIVAAARRADRVAH